MAHLVWLITGCSSGLGLCLSKAVLAAGHQVIATSRNPSKTPETVAEVEKDGKGKWMRLDVTADDLEQQVDACIKIFGKVDVLVNNAGYGSGGTLEDMAISEVRRQMETNFFGAVRTTKTLIPHMRARRSGTIINVTSTEGISGSPGIGVYGASKHALEGLSEALFAELAPLGIRVLTVEPGAMRTSFLDPENIVEAPMSAHYKTTIADQVIEMLREAHGKQMLDPERSAKRIVEAVAGGGEGWPETRTALVRLPLGREVIQRTEAKIKMLQENIKAMEGVWTTVDFDT